MSADSSAFVPAGSAVYAIGDIHGRLDLLVELHALIAADAAQRQAQRRVLVHVGDYVDRGPDSARVLDRLMDRIPAGFEPVYLLGNHERLMLDFMDDLNYGPVWLRNGGRETLASYGVDVTAGAATELDHLTRVQAELRERLPDSHRAFLAALELGHLEGDYLFVHAGIRPGLAVEAQDEGDLIWIREPFLSSDQNLGKIVVHGHTIAPEPVIRQNRIGIDTGAYYTGRLTALVLEGGARDFLVTG